MVRFSFALSQRMRSFLEVRDALHCLDLALARQQPRDWLHAACDLRASLLGDQGRKSVIPEVVGLLISMQTHLNQLGKDIPQYKEGIEQACRTLDKHVQVLHAGLADAINFLAQDALINAYLNTQKKQDWLGHKLGLPQSIDTLWTGNDERSSWLHHSLKGLNAAVRDLNQMLNDYVQWEKDIAVGGCGQIAPERGSSNGLLIIGLPEASVASGIVPDISGNKLAIRLRFQRWVPGEPPHEVSEDQPYAMMLIPVA